MKWVKPTQESLDMFDDLIPFAPGVEKRKVLVRMSKIPSIISAILWQFLVR